MTQYTVRATSEVGAIMTFGLSAEDYDRAMLTALDRVPWPPKVITVQPLLPPVAADRQDYKAHIKHTERHDGCRFCV